MEKVTHNIFGPKWWWKIVIFSHWVFWIPNKNHPTSKKTKKKSQETNYQSLPMENLTSLFLPQKNEKKNISPRTWKPSMSLSRLQGLRRRRLRAGYGYEGRWVPKIGVFGEFSFVQWKKRISWVWLLFCAAMLGSLIGLRARAFPKKVECSSWVASTGSSGWKTSRCSLFAAPTSGWFEADWARRCKECTVATLQKHAHMLQTGLRCLVFKRSTNSQSSTLFSLIQRVLYWKKVMKQLNLCGGCWFLHSTVPKT